MPIKTALVTGAHGFTGRYMLAALRARGYRTYALVERPSDEAESITCDLTNAEVTERAIRQVQPNMVVHLAAVSFVGHGHPEQFYCVNVFGTLNLLEALSKLKVPPSSVLIASSANVYGSPHLEVIDEDVCPVPVNHYGNSKLAMEFMVRTWFERLPIVITRPFNYTGPGQDDRFLIPKIVNHFRNKAPVIELGNLDVSRDFSDVVDVVAAYIALLEKHTYSEIVNICSGRSVSLREVISMLNSLAGYEIEVQVNPALVREQEIRRLLGDNRKLKRLVNMAPSTPLLHTLKRMLSV